MHIERYLQWVELAPVRARMEAARTLVDAYSCPELDAGRRIDVELALFALLDDPATAVRRALAEALAFSADVPRHLVAALAQDHATVSIPLLLHSPLLSEADLVDAAAIGTPEAQVAIASRAVIRAPLAAAMAEIGSLEALIALCDNAQAEILPESLRQMLARFPADGALREALLHRDDLDGVTRHELVEATARDLTGFAVTCAWMSPERAERVVRESRDRGAIVVATRARREGLREMEPLVRHLRHRGHLTPALLLRAILSGNTELFEAALADLACLPRSRVEGQVRHWSGLGFASLYARAKLPVALLPVFRAALAAARYDDDERPAGTLRRTSIVDVLRACEANSDATLQRTAALLRRFEAESVRDEARALVAAAWAEDDSVPALMPFLVSGQGSVPQLTFQEAA